jgi:hypothetical protein
MRAPVLASGTACPRVACIVWVDRLRLVGRESDAGVVMNQATVRFGISVPNFAEYADPRLGGTASSSGTTS